MRPFISVTALVASSGDEKQTKPNPFERETSSFPSPPSFCFWFNSESVIIWTLAEVMVPNWEKCSRKTSSVIESSKFLTYKLDALVTLNALGLQLLELVLQLCLALGLFRKCFKVLSLLNTFRLQNFSQVFYTESVNFMYILTLESNFPVQSLSFIKSPGIMVVINVK